VAGERIGGLGVEYGKDATKDADQECVFASLWGMNVGVPGEGDPATSG
jgi:hypothetical protein